MTSVGRMLPLSVSEFQDTGVCMIYIHVCVYIYMIYVYVPGSGSCHGHGHSPSTPAPPVEWVGSVGRGGGHPTSNSNATGRMR